MNNAPSYYCSTPVYKGGDVRLYLLGTQAVLKSFAGHTWQVLPWQKSHREKVAIFLPTSLKPTTLDRRRRRPDF